MLTAAYDARDRIVAVDWSDATPDVAASYDARGRLLAVSNPHSALSYSYDDAGQLLAETQDLQSPVNLPPRR